MSNRYILFVHVLKILLYSFFTISSARDIHCRDADAGGTIMRNKERKFLIIGGDASGGAGLGNLLIFFPAAYYFATFTQREILIPDKSVIGEMCNIIQCGFPFVGDLSKAFPDILTKENIIRAPNIKAWDFQRYMEGSREINEAVVRADGYMPKSDWWVYYNTTVHCVSKVTGCDLGDIPCADRHAYQRLIRGPFRASLTEKEEARISGVPQHIKHAILTLPHSYAPRLDAAIHIRAQFAHFEQSSDINDPEYKKEVADWLNSTECSQVFNAFEEKLIASIKETRQYQITASNLSATVANATMNEPVYVYLAADNEEVKSEFAKILQLKHHENDIEHNHFDIRVMRVESKLIHHIKHINKLKNATNGEGVLDLVFDWYSLSLSNTIFGWRKGSTGMVSTFVQSAQRVSGTIDRTDVRKPIGLGGVGSKGFQMTKDKRGNMKWDPMWINGFPEDYLINGHRKLIPFNISSLHRYASEEEMYQHAPWAHP